MSTRLNKRFIIILTASMFALGVLVAGVAYIAISGDAERQVRKAQELEAQGEYSDAVDRYARAIGKDPTNLDYYDMLESALLKLVPESRAESRERYSQYLAVLAKRKGASVDNPASWDRVIEEFSRRARIIGGAGDAWYDVQDQAERMVDEFGFREDESAVAATARANAYIANSMAWRIDLLKPQEREDFDELVEEMIAAETTNPLLWEGALRVKLVEASRHKAKGDERLVRRELDGPEGFDGYQAKLLELGVEQTPEIQALRIQRYELDRADEAAAAEYRTLYDAFDAEVRALVERIIASEDPDSLASDEDLLRRSVMTMVLGNDAVVELLQPLLAEGNLPMDLSLVIYKNMAQSDPDTAILAARQTLDVDPMSVSLLAMMQGIARQQAALSIFDALYMQVASEKEGVSAVDLRVAREEAAREYEGDPQYEDVLMYMDGAIAFAEDDLIAARSQLSEVAGRPLMNDPIIQRRFLPRFIAVMIMTGERGVAIDQLQEYASNLSPRAAIGLRKSIANELIRVGRLEDAMNEIQQILSVDPTDEEGLALRDNLLERRERLSESAAGVATPQARVFTLASGALGDGRLEDARQVLTEAIAKFEADQFKHMLITVETMLGNSEEALRIAGMFDDPENNEILQRQLILIETEDPIERVDQLVQLLEEEESVQKSMRYIYLQRLAYGSDPEDAEAASALLEDAFAVAIADLPDSRNVRQRVVISSIEDERRSDWAAGPESASQRALDALEAVETDEIHFINTKARILVQTRDPEAALDLLAPLDERGLANSDTWFTRGQAYALIGRLEESLTAFENAYERSPDSIQIVKAYIDALEYSGEQDKALGILRSSRRSDRLAFALRDDWLNAESIYGDQREALNQRRRILLSDLGESRVEDGVVDITNALELARLMLTVPIDRQDIMRNGEVVYSPTAWDSMRVSRRREVIAAERASRRAFTFNLLEGLETRARSDQERLAVGLVMAQAHRLADQVAEANQKIDEIIECCNSLLAPSQRLILIDVMRDLGRTDQQLEQYMLAAQEATLEQKRALVDQIAAAGYIPESVDVAESMYADSGSPIDGLIVVERLAQLGELERANTLLERIEVEQGDTDDDYLRYLLSLSRGAVSSMEGRAALDNLAKLDSRIAKLQNSGDSEGLRQVTAELDQTKADAVGKLKQGVEALREVDTSSRARLTPKIRMHNLLKLQVMLENDDSLKAEILDNARQAVDLDPVNWTAVQCLMQAHLIMANPSEALSVVDQYFRRGGMAQPARASIMEVARLEGKPGLAIPSLERAMERDPSNSIWPKSIARLLLETGRNDEAAEMLWRSIELESTVDGVAEFIRVEFMRPDPDMKRISEAIAMQESIVDDRPDLKAAYATALVDAGNIRQGEEMYLDAVRTSRAFLDSPSADALIVDRVLGYHNRIFPNDSISDMENRLRSEIGELGIHDYSSLASACVSSANPTPEDIGLAIEYLKKAAEIPTDDQVYLKILLDRLASYSYFSGECEQAIETLQRIVSMGNPAGQSLNNLAYMMLDCNGDASGAIVYSVRALQKGPANPQYLDTHGTILLELGRYAEAEPLITQAVAIKPSASNLIHYAQLLVRTERNEQARVIIRRISTEFPQLSAKQQALVNELIDLTS